MQGNEKLLALLGFCAKSGQCVLGEEGVSAAVKSGKAKLALLDAEASDNTKKKVRDMCARRKVPLLELYEDIGAAAGKPGRKLLAVTDENFARSIRAAYTKEDTGIDSEI